MNTPHRPWYRELTRYHWFVLAVAALGWMFDTMDQQIFVLARNPALKELLVTPDGNPPADKVIAEYGGHATSIFLIGWATGGLIFGVLGDRYGRARVMMWTILIYSVCTGLSAFAVGYWDFAFYRFITGLGVGGEFAVGVALVAEVMPDRARPFALGLLQALSAVGNISAALISIGLGQMAEINGYSSWRVMFMVGTIPALLAVVIRRRLKEPERWQGAVEQGSKTKRAGSYTELFSHPVWRKNALIGLALAFSGVVGLWGIGFFSPELLNKVLVPKFEAEGYSGDELSGKLFLWKGIFLILQNIGGFFGIYAYSRITHVIGRRGAFAISFVAAAASTVLVFGFMREFNQAFWMIPLMGFCQLSLFGGYAIYFPELFPTHLRSTGTSFCYNVGRFVAAVGPSALGMLTSRVYSGDDAFRYAALTMCSVFSIGLIATYFAPETHGKPLPE